ncbi:hypothetical protein H4Q26_006718 [Puccinia striiformis f. sp. tritici PST-130]|nr:hypothetical protein H4Q26_006718 [Puccinia striiformis f. sp. tritici PST-130]
MDLTQDSHHKNNKAKKTRKNRARKDSEFGLDNIELYFHKPVFSNGATTFTLEPDAEGQTQGEGTRGNLVKHRDGTANQAPCTHQANAIRAGAKLPLTAKEVAAVRDRDIGKNSEFSGAGRFLTTTAAKEMVADKSRAFNFDHRILNQIIVMWLVRHSLPWNRIEDHEIDFAFRYSQPGLKLNSWVWAASEAHKLYCNLQEKVISTLNYAKSLIEAQFESKRIELEAHAPTTRHPPTSEEPRDGI